jgi:pimeloyl-ACP methyl ester carboxylesterase
VFLEIAKTINPQEYVSWLVILGEVKQRLDDLFDEPFKTPTLMIMGSQDHAFIRDSIRFCKKNPVTRLQIIPSCGHLSNIEKYAEFNQAALNFLMNS